MGELQLKVRELVWNEKKSKVFVDSFVFEPSNIEEEEMGNLYFVTQVFFDQEQTPANSKINTLVSLIKREFYADFKKGYKKGFENALKKANLLCQEFKQNGVLRNEQIDFFIANLRGMGIQFSKSSDMPLILIRDRQIIRLTKKAISAGKETENEGKMFDSIASGRLRPNDTMIISTEDIFNKISKEKFFSLYESLDFDDFIKSLQKNIKPQSDTSVRKKQNYAFLFLKIAEEGQFKKTATFKEIDDTDKSSESIFLSLPSLPESVKSKFQAAWQKITLLPQGSVKIIKGISGKIHNKKYAYVEDDLVHRGTHSHKIRIAIASIMILALGFGFFAYDLYLKNRQFEQEIFTLKQNLNQMVAVIGDTTNREDAKSKLADYRSKANALLVSFAAGTNIKNQAKDLIQETESAENEIFKNIFIKNLTKQTDFKHNLFTFSPQKIELGNNNILSFGSPLSLYYKYDLSENNGSFSFLNIPPDKTLGLLIRKDGNNIILTDSTMNVYTADIVNSRIVSSATIDFFTESYPKDIKTYSGNLYFLSPENNQIIKLTENNKQSKWIKEDIDLKNAQSIEIDGNILILHSDGTIDTLRSGKKISSINLGFPSETFLRIKRVLSSEDYSVLAKSNIIYIFDKDWKFKSRFLFESLESDIQDYIVDNKSMKIFILTGGILYSSPVPIF